MVSSRTLEAILQEIRKNTIPHEEESYDAFNQRTWHMTLLRWEQEKPELPRVQEQQAKSRQASRRAGKPQVEKDED